MQTNNNNILAQANAIVNERSEEKAREYGPFNEGMDRAAMIATGMSGRNVSAHDLFIALTALKLSRQSYAFKTDNLLDCVAYIGAWDNYIQANPIVSLAPNAKLQIFQDLSKGDIVTVRGLKTRELLNYTIKIQPYDRFFDFVGRNYKISYFKKELLWYIKGDKFDTSIKQHAALWKTLINADGSINSQYGHYIFKRKQFHRCVDTLSKDMYSRRAVISILNEDHLSSDTNDYPCTMNMIFAIRNNKLLMTVNMRSNDAIYGMCNDIPIFSCIHEMLFVYLRDTVYPNLMLGEYTHNVVSFHIYENHFAMLNNIIANKTENKIEAPRISSKAEVDYLLTANHDIVQGFDFHEWLLSN